MQALTKKLKGPVLCFVGPPGVGKTTPREEHRARDGAQVRAAIARRRARRGRDPRPPAHVHRRAARASIIQSAEEGRLEQPASSCSTRSTRCRPTSVAIPAAALLEVLDPEQNGTFNDHYLDLDYDLSAT